MSHVQTAPQKEQAKITPNAQPTTPKSEVILSPQHEEVKPQKSVIEIAKSVNNLNGLLKNHSEFTARLEEIAKFKTLISDGSGCNLVITHSSGTSISFTNLEFIHHFVKEAFSNGEKALGELELKITNSSL